MPIFFIIFIVIPVMEIAVFMAVGEHIGLFTTLLLALLTAIIGGGIVKHQGLQTLAALRSAMNRGQMPLNELFDGFCLIAAGATLITPGFVTDTIGFLLLIPQIREILRTIIKNHTSWSMDSYDSGVIEAEYERVDDNTDKRS